MRIKNKDFKDVAEIEKRIAKIWKAGVEWNIASNKKYIAKLGEVAEDDREFAMITFWKDINKELEEKVKELSFEANTMKAFCQKKGWFGS